jgi:hypothetical protein
VEASVSNLLSPGEVNLARVGRILHDSRKYILDARDDLENHQRWLTRHRMASADDPTRFKQPRISAFKRLAINLVGYVASASIALRRGTIWIFASLFDLLSVGLSRLCEGCGLVLSPERQARCFETTAHHATAARHPKQAPMRGLEVVCTLPLVAPEVAKFRETRFSPFVIPSLAGPKIIISILGVIAVALVAAGVLRATVTGQSAGVNARAPVVQSFTGSAAAGSTTRLKTPRPPPSSAPISGFSLVATTFNEPLSLPPQTIASMMAIASPVTLASEESVRVPAIAKEALAIKPVKPKLRPAFSRKVVTHEPQQQPSWWQRLPLIRIR